MKPVAITGLGIVSTLGVGRTVWMNALGDPAQAKKSAFRQTSNVLDAEGFEAARTAEVWDWEPSAWLGAKGHRNFDRLTKFMITAAGLALEDAGIKKTRGPKGAFSAYGPDRVGVASATAYGSLDAIAELKKISELEDPRYINPTRFPNTVINAAAGYVSIWEDLQAPNTTIVDGNCGALDAVLNCETHLYHGRADAFLLGGGEVVSEALYIALQKLGVVSEDHDDGVTMGEGACYVVAERLADARERDAEVIAEIIGYGTAFDPPESEAVLVGASPRAVAMAMRAALVDAEVDPSDIDLVCSAAAGLDHIDGPEDEGIKEVLGMTCPVAAPKTMVGETFGAAGAFAIATALGWMHGGVLPELERGEAPARLHHVLVNTVGFYGNVSTVVLRMADA